MGSYNMIVNLDKKESLSPHDFGGGAKWRNGAITMIRWCGPA